jgi:VIT1/CCC1 family predicted Fe2+/Mn2+ transporter
MRRHVERHLIERIGWLRAAILGANDGIISTASLMVGVASASSPASQILLTGIAGLVAGSMSMAAGEYVSVSSQADTEKADLARERAELSATPAEETTELANIYVSRGVDSVLARQVAIQLMAKDALAAHAKDELGISSAVSANPIQAGVTSAMSFAAGATAPILVTLFAPASFLPLTIAGCSLVFLAILGAIGAKVGGAPVLKATFRVAFWGALAMAVTAGIGTLIGKAV